MSLRLNVVMSGCLEIDPFHDSVGLSMPGRSCVAFVPLLYCWHTRQPASQSVSVFGAQRHILEHGRTTVATLVASVATLLTSHVVSEHGGCACVFQARNASDT